MILLISTCTHKLHEEEFVKPIANLVKDYEIKHYTEYVDIEKYSRIIICGTALKDDEFLNNLDKFKWLKNIQIPVLGICSGFQIIGLSFGAKIKKKTEIGMVEIETKQENNLFLGKFKAYAMHNNVLENLNNFEILGESKECVHAIKHKEKNIYGVLFHPEVRNNKIIVNFIK